MQNSPSSDINSKPVNSYYSNASEFKNIPELSTGLVRLENETWPEGTRAAQAAFESRIDIFSDGVFFHTENQDFWGLSTSLITQISDPNTIDSWETITDDGMIRTHNPRGNALYVVSVGVSPRFQWRGIGRQLIAYQISLAQRLGLEYIVLGSRVPGFHTFNGDIESYLALQTADGRSVDSLISFYQGCGLEIGKIKSDYMEDDRESRNYGVIMFKHLKPSK